MYDFIKKNIYLIFLFIITLSIGFLTFLTFIDKGFIELSDQNLQLLLIINIVLLTLLFVFIFFEIKKAIRNDIDKDGLKSNNKYCKFDGFNLIKLRSINVKNVKKHMNSVILDRVMMNIFFFKNSNIN